jgi:hypothetical protein
MTDALEQQTVAETQPDASERRSSRWTRTHLIWLLIFFSLLPAMVIALFREEWTGAPAGVRAAIYLICTIFMSVAVVLIVLGGRDRTS